MAFRDKLQEFMVLCQVCKFCESRDGRKKFTALTIRPVNSLLPTGVQTKQTPRSTDDCNYWVLWVGTCYI